MKKLLALILVLVLSLTALVSCEIPESVSGVLGTVKDKVGGVVDTVKDKVNEILGKEPATNAGLEAADAYLFDLYKNAAKETPSNFTLVSKVTIDGVTYTVTWTTDNKDVTVGAAEDPNFVLVTVPKANADLAYTLTATIADANGNTLTRTFSRVVPKFKVFSYAEYAAAEDDTTVVVQGIVTGIFSNSNGSSGNGVYIQDLNNEGGYYVYGLADPEKGDPAQDLGLKVGNTVTVSGTKDTYNGLYEVVKATITIDDASVKTVTPVDLTDAYKNATALTDEALIGKQSILATVKGVEIGGVKEDNGYYYFKLGALESYIRISSSNNCITKDEIEVFKGNHTSHKGFKADVTGIVQLYNGAFYLIPATVDAESNYAEIERTADEKIVFELEGITIPEIVSEATDLTAPATGSKYTEVKFAWTSDSECVVVKDGKLVITLPEETTVVTITLKANCEGAEEVTKTYKIKVIAAAKNPFVAEQTPNPATGTAYKFFVYNAFHGKNFFFNGQIDDKFLQSSDNYAEAVDVYLEEVKAEDNKTVIGYRFYFDNNGTKTYIDITADGKAALVTENPNAVYNYVAETNCWATAAGEKEYYIGSYVYNNKSYTTFGASETKHIKPDNTGVTQFPANFAELVVKKVVAEQVKTPAAATPYKFFVFNVHHNDFFYFNGSISGDFLQTTNNIYNAVDVYLEEVKDADGKVIGYRFYFDNNGTKTYIDINANGKAALVTENPNAVYTYKAETNCWATAAGTKECYLGSYLNKGKSYTTIGASETRYITADNTGVTQFPANFGLLTVLSDKVITDEEKVETEKKALTFVSEVLKATDVEVPTAGETYSEVEITWTVDGVAVENGKIAFVIGKASKTVKVVATVKSGEVTDTKEFKVFVAGDPDAVSTPITSDIETSTTGGNAGGYVDERVTENGWSVTYAQLITGKEWAGANNYGWVINGKVGVNGVITSPKFNGGVGTVKFNYGFPFSDTKVKLTVAIVDAEGKVLVSNTLERTDLVKDTAYEYVWNLTAEESAKVTGDCRLVITNECLSGSTNSNKDRLMVWNISIEAPAAEAHTHVDTNNDTVCDVCQKEIDVNGDTPTVDKDAN